MTPEELERSQRIRWLMTVVTFWVVVAIVAMVAGIAVGGM